MNNYHKQWVKSIAHYSSDTSVYSPKMIKTVEMAAFSRGVAEYTLMKRAGLACWQRIKHDYPGVRSMGIVCGGGNNGGDGWVVARLAARSGVAVQVFSSKIPTKGAAASAFQDAQLEPITLVSSVEPLAECDLVVDALIGTGFSGTLRSEEMQMVEAINRLNKAVIAVDVPSGLNPITGEASPVAVVARQTVTFIGLKMGLVTGQASRYAGQVFCAELGLDPDDYSTVGPMAHLATKDGVMRQFPTRAGDAHKGLCGHILIVGGCERYGGAVILAAMGALQAGAGKVSVSCDAAHRSALLSHVPESMWVDPEGIDDALESIDAVVMGMGLGQGEWSRTLFSKVMACSKPLILDADGLTLWALSPKPRMNTIITPHPGEARRLLRATQQPDDLDRVGQAKGLSHLCPRGVVVLKGSGTVIYVSGGIPIISVTGNAGMATGGMGDLLAGVIGGFVGQGVSLGAAAMLGVYEHGWSADEMANECGVHALTPSILLKALGRLKVVSAD